MQKILDMFIIIVLAIILGSLRISGIKDQAFQAAAHLYVGGLFVAWRCTKEKFYLYIFAILTILEVVCFFLVK